MMYVLCTSIFVLFFFSFQKMSDFLNGNCFIDISNYSVDVVIEKPPQVTTCIVFPLILKSYVQMTT